MSTKPHVRYSFVNLATAVAATSEDTEYPASNLLEPRRPFMPWKSTSLSAQTLTVTLSGNVDLVILVGANFTQASVNGDAITIERNPHNWRYQHGLFIQPATPTLSIVITASQTPVDGDTVYRLGGIWAGMSTIPPMNPRYELEPSTLVPSEDLQPSHKGWMQRLNMGDPVAAFRTRRVARADRIAPALADQLQQWTEIDRQAMAVDRFAFFFNSGDPTQAYIMRYSQPTITWTRPRRRIAESQVDMEEVVA